MKRDNSGMPETNADIIGKTVTLAEKEWTVTMAMDQPPNYVYLVRPSDGEGNEDRQDMILRPVGLVRRHLQLEREAR